jgi:hypothetical protein
MRSFSRLLFGIAILTAFGFAAWWLFFTDLYPKYTIYPAGSAIEDEEALGGFGPCDNYPRDIAGETWGTADDISLVAFPDESFRGNESLFTVRLVNRTNAVAGFSACDSCLYLTQEALDRSGTWRPIERSFRSWCGNSYHRVFLDKNQYWEFPALRYHGTIKTKLRLRLEQGTTHRREIESGVERGKKVLVTPCGGGRVIHSNEFDGWINESLFLAAEK